MADPLGVTLAASLALSLELSVSVSPTAVIEDEVRARLSTYFRDRSIRKSVDKARRDGASAEEAFAAVAPDFNLSPERVRRIVYRQ